MRGSVDGRLGAGRLARASPWRFPNFASQFQAKRNGGFVSFLPGRLARINAASARVPRTGLDMPGRTGVAQHAWPREGLLAAAARLQDPGPAG